MKILAFTDLHGSQTALRRIAQKVKSQKPDILVCTGDVSIFENGFFNVIKKLNRLNKKIVSIHGNHEEPEIFLKSSKRFKNIIFIHRKEFIFNNVLFLGFGGGGFSVVDKEFEKIAGHKFREIIKNNPGKKIILLTHAPPYKTKLDKIDDGYCGNKSIRHFIEKNRVDYLICGHIHENFGKEDKIGKTVCINPGPFGKIVEV